MEPSDTRFTREKSNPSVPLLKFSKPLLFAASRFHIYCRFRLPLPVAVWQGRIWPCYHNVRYGEGRLFRRYRNRAKAELKGEFMAEETVVVTAESAPGEDPGSGREPGASVAPPEPLVGGTAEDAAGKPAAAETGGEQKAETDSGSQETGTEETGEGEKGPSTRAPEEYAEFSFPEGVTLDEAGVAEFKSFAKEQDLTQEQAQKVLEYGGFKLKERLEAPYKTWTEMQTKWQAEVKADPEIGGTKFEESIRNASLVFVPGESNPFVKDVAEAQTLREALNTTGAGNNPAMVRLFVKIGRLLAEPGPLPVGKPASVDKQGDLLAKMYPTMDDKSS
jgi:hypothetical protein